MIDSNKMLSRINFSPSDDESTFIRSLEEGNYKAFGKNAEDFFNELNALKKGLAGKVVLENTVKSYIKKIVDEFNSGIYNP